MSRRLYPLREAEDYGVLVKAGYNPRPVVFLTPQQAKSLQARKERAA